jgi:hypothetical protein
MRPPDHVVPSMNGWARLTLPRRRMRNKDGRQVQTVLSGPARADVNDIKRQSFDFGPP